jgi:hypothetical protein
MKAMQDKIRDEKIAKIIKELADLKESLGIKL